MIGGGSPRVVPTRAATAAALLGIACLSACGSGTRHLDSVKIERSIQQSVAQQRGLHSTVTCPAQVPQEAGRVFTCDAHLDVGIYPVTVTEIGSGGQVRFADRRPLIVLNIAKVRRAIETSVSRQRKVSASVSCPSEVLQRAGIVFRCTAVVEGTSHRYPFAVTELDNAGHVRFLGI